MKPDRDGWLLAGGSALRRFVVLPQHAAAEAPRPNVVFILADDLGYGDLGVLRRERHRHAEHRSARAREGMRFTDFYSVANTCSPSRAALMTGRYPPRSGVNAVLFHDTPEGLPRARDHDRRSCCATPAIAPP